MAWKIDPMHTQVEFSAKHFGMMTVRGHFNEISVTGNVDPAQPETSQIDVVINVASLNTNSPQRDNDLRSSYFLELDKFPTITFHSTGVKARGADELELSGDLTIKGITRPLTLAARRYGEINDPRMGHRIAYSAEGEINRKDFGMEFDMLADNRLVVSHEIKIYIELETIEVKEDAAVGATA